ncbi:MAG: NAD+ synthase [Phycisphaerales bacterium]|nr:NAD+ synthase [Phycisphaerales bacterium]
MRIALAQVNPTVGDVAGNARALVDAATLARSQGADLVVGPEMALLGYPPRDLLLREGVVESCERAVMDIARAARGVTVLVGHPRRAEGGSRPLRNSVSAVRDGRVVAVYDKRLLPTYDVFDEDRHFSPGTVPVVVEAGGLRVGVLVCEDLWMAGDAAVVRRYGIDCVAETARLGCDLLAVPSASPFVLGKPARHLAQLREAARRGSCPVVSVNQVGANDDMIFDGGSVVMAADGAVVAAAGSWKAATVVAGLDDRRPTAPPPDDALADLWHALVLGVGDYLRKTGNARAVLGISGGIDSALTAAIAVGALGPDRVAGLLMPSRYSSAGSVDDALELARRLRLGRVETVPIEAGHTAMADTLSACLGASAQGVVDENVQSRLRGLVVMAFSNATGSLALATGNKSELAVGYCTLYGDMVGALAVIGDLVKGRVYALSRWVNANHRACGFAEPPIPESSIEKAPSAELRPDQTDQDSLPPYEDLDPVVEALVDEDRWVDGAAASTGRDPATVARIAGMLDRNEYKRRQAPLVLKVTARTFGPGRRMPLALRQEAKPNG